MRQREKLAERHGLAYVCSRKKTRPLHAMSSLMAIESICSTSRQERAKGVIVLLITTTEKQLFIVKHPIINDSQELKYFKRIILHLIKYGKLGCMVNQPDVYGTHLPVPRQRCFFVFVGACRDTPCTRENDSSPGVHTQTEGYFHQTARYFPSATHLRRYFQRLSVDDSQE